MSSVGMREAYKARLRENTSIAKRRKSRGAERKNKRDDEINKRRQLPTISPVVEKFENNTTDIKRMKMKGPNQKNAVSVMERLRQYREEKKRRFEQEKMNNKAKPTFKVGIIDRKCDVELFTANKNLTKGKEVKTSKKAIFPAKQETVAKREIKRNIPVDNTRKNNPTKLTSEAKPAKKPVKLDIKRSEPLKNQSGKEKESMSNVRNKAKMMRATKSTADLASKLTVAAAAKRNVPTASPKKFLRATRATTLQKKEPMYTKKATKGMDGASKSTGNLLSQKKREDFDYGQGESSRKQLATFNPQDVPKVLDNFDFSAIDNGKIDAPITHVENSTQDPKADSNDILETESSPLKSKRKSMRKSNKLAALEINSTDVVITQAVAENDNFDNLITLTPGMSKRRSVRRSTRLSSVAKKSKIPFEADLSEIAHGATSTNVLLTPNVRKSARKSRALGSSASKKFEDLQISRDDTAKSGISTADSKKRGSRKSLCFISKSIEENIDLSLKEKLEEGISDEPHISLGGSNSKRNITKSSASETNEDLVRSNSIKRLDSGFVLSGEDFMEVDAVQHTTSDADTQVAQIEITSTPKSARRKSKNLRMNTLTASSIEDVSSTESIPNRTPKLRSRRSVGARSRRSSHSRRRSWRSNASPAISQVSVDSMESGELNNSGAATPNSRRNIENIPPSATFRSSARKSTVISVSDEGTAVGRDLELALAYKVEKPPPSAKASRILKELIIERIEGEESFEVSYLQSGNNTPNLSCGNLSSKEEKLGAVSSMPFTPRESDELTVSNDSSNCLTTPKSVPRHSTIGSGFKEPGLPLSALRSAPRRRNTECGTPTKTPEQMIKILKKSPMIEMARRRSRHTPSPAPAKGQYFRDLVTCETDKLTNLCNKWNDITSKEPGLDEEVLGQIRSTVGKALLLIGDRFKQFSGLVDNYVYNLGEKETTPTDLQGFWEMIYFQVEDIESKFKELDELQQANWQFKKYSPKVAPKLLKKTISKGKTNIKGVKSNFASFRAEMLKKKALQAKAASTAREENDVEIVI